MSPTSRLALTVALLSPLLAMTAQGQDSGAAKVYRDQFAVLHARTKAILSRVEEQGRNSSAFDPRSVQEVKSAQEMREEILALTKLVDTLGEDAERSYVDDLRKGLEGAKAGQNATSPNKSLLFVQSGCGGMGFVLGALYNYLESGDRAFLGFAKKGEELTTSIEVVL